jgi:hypothetical protein
MKLLSRQEMNRLDVMLRCKVATDPSDGTAG